MEYRSSYNCVFLVLTYGIPMLIMIVCYTIMGRVLWGSQSIGEHTQRQIESIKSKKKVCIIRSHLHMFHKSFTVRWKLHLFSICFDDIRLLERERLFSSHHNLYLRATFQNSTSFNELTIFPLDVVSLFTFPLLVSLPPLLLLLLVFHHHFLLLFLFPCLFEGRSNVYCCCYHLCHMLATISLILRLLVSSAAHYII